MLSVCPQARGICQNPQGDIFARESYPFKRVILKKIKQNLEDIKFGTSSSAFICSSHRHGRRMVRPELENYGNYGT